MRFIALLLAVFFTAGRLHADGTKMEPEEMSAADLLKVINAHFFKWSYQPEKPYNQLTFRFNYFTRMPSLMDRLSVVQEGEFWRRTIHENTIHFPSGSHQRDDIIIYTKFSDWHGELLLNYGLWPGSSVGIALPASYAKEGYSTVGGGGGGLPLIIGSEYILMSHNINGYARDKKGLADYVSVEISSE